jgi:3-oxoacyl-[acyl-carrier protein] reductase
MNLLLMDKVALISGSSRGIGKGIAAVLLQEGCRVALTGRTANDVESTRQELKFKYPDSKVLGFTGDMSSDQALDGLSQRVLSEWGRIDCLVANAGAVKPVEAWNISAEDWEWYMHANFNVAVRFIRRFIPQLIQTRGAVVVVGSIAGLEDIDAPLPYSSAKAALSMYSKGLARKLAPHHIRVNCVAPGNVVFSGGNWDKKCEADPEAVNTLLQAKVPMNRFGTPEEIGAACAFLLSERSSFTTGACLVVDGGHTALFI